MAEARSRSVRVKEVWGPQAPEPTPPGAVVSWERKHLELTAYSGYEVYAGTLPLHDARDWRVGVYDDLEDAAFEQLLVSMERVPDHDIYPLFETGLTQFCPETWTDRDYFLKGPDVSSNKSGNDGVARLTLAEARIHQTLAPHPHANLGTFLGCVVYGGRIVRLALPRYVETLSDRVSGPARITDEERRACLDGVRSAAAHLHALGYAHNDISASNIMFDSGGEAVLIDLDSCTPIGEKLKKGGVVGGWRGPHYCGRRFERSSVECDELSLQYIQDWLVSLDEAG